MVAIAVGQWAWRDRMHDSRSDRNIRHAPCSAHALSLGATLVTNNTKHFQRVSGLMIANWI
jgi:predicted nucleic acid-binding protein